MTQQKRVRQRNRARLFVSSVVRLTVARRLASLLLLDVEIQTYRYLHAERREIHRLHQTT